MNTEHALEQQLNQVNEGFRQAEMARKYKEITEAQGPSQQLIDFINADGKLGEEIGLEGFESFSTSTQHEILLSKLNPDEMEAVAMEGFGDFVKKYRGWLTGAGVVALWATGPGIVTAALLAAGVSGLVMKFTDSIVIDKGAFVKWANAIDDGMAALEASVRGLPSDTNEGSWEKFAAAFDSEFSKYANPTDDLVKATAVTSTLKKSGWTPETLIAQSKWMENTVTKFEAMRKSFNSKIAKFESMEDKIPKGAVKAIGTSSKFFREIDGDLMKISSELKKVSKGFTIAKKKD